MRMVDLSPGESAWVESLDASGRVRRRLLDLGLVSGTKVKALRKSPLGDPTLYLIRGAMIALRKEEASLIKVLDKE